MLILTTPTIEGKTTEMAVADLLPGPFDKSHMD